MSGLNISTDIAKESLHALSRLKSLEGQGKSSQGQEVQTQSQLTGIIWSQKAAGPEIAVSDVDDLALLTTSVSMNDESVEAPDNFRLSQSMRIILNPSALEESFKDVFKKSRSHNLLLERFMANVKLSGLNFMMSLCGIEPGMIEEIKAQVREEALKEIDIKLSQDWAYTKAMIDITGG